MNKWTLNRINVQNYDPDENLFNEDVNSIVFIIIFSVIIFFLVSIVFKSKQIEKQLEDDEQKNVD